MKDFCFVNKIWTFEFNNNLKLSLVFITTPKKEIDGILKTVFEFVFAQVKQIELKSCIILDFIKVIKIWRSSYNF